MPLGHLSSWRRRRDCEPLAHLAVLVLVRVPLDGKLPIPARNSVRGKMVTSGSGSGTKRGRQGCPVGTQRNTVERCVGSQWSAPPQACGSRADSRLLDLLVPCRAGHSQNFVKVGHGSKLPEWGRRGARVRRAPSLRWQSCWVRAWSIFLRQLRSHCHLRTLAEIVCADWPRSALAIGRHNGAT